MLLFLAFILRLQVICLERRTKMSTGHLAQAHNLVIDLHQSTFEKLAVRSLPCPLLRSFLWPVPASEAPAAPMQVDDSKDVRPQMDVDFSNKISDDEQWDLAQAESEAQKDEEEAADFLAWGTLQRASGEHAATPGGDWGPAGPWHPGARAAEAIRRFAQGWAGWATRLTAWYQEALSSTLEFKPVAGLYFSEVPTGPGQSRILQAFHFPLLFPELAQLPGQHVAGHYRAGAASTCLQVYASPHDLGSDTSGHWGPHPDEGDVLHPRGPPEPCWTWPDSTPKLPRHSPEPSLEPLWNLLWNFVERDLALH